MHSAVKRRFEHAAVPRVSGRALQQGAVLLAAYSFGNLLQYLFHVLASRWLGPAEYGIVVSLLGASVILSVPTSIAQTVMTQYVSGFFARNEPGKISALLVDATKRFSLISLAIFGLVVLFSPIIAAFLNIPETWPVIAMGSTFLLIGPLTSITASLQGLQRFYSVAAQAALGAGFRLASGAILIVLGLGASGALGAQTVSNLLVVVIFAFSLRDRFQAPVTEHGLTLRAVSQYSGIVFFGTLAFAVLTNMDVLIVKHFFSPEEAGYYSSASVLGKIILFFPTAISTMMFPKTSFRFALGQSASDLARKSLLVSAGLCAAGALVLAVFPRFAVSLLFGEQYDPSISLVGLYGMAMALCALVQLVLNFYLSQQEARFVWLLVAVTAALIVFLAFVHVTLAQVIISLAVGAAAVLLIGELWLDGLGLVRSVRAVFE